MNLKMEKENLNSFEKDNMFKYNKWLWFNLEKIVEWDN